MRNEKKPLLKTMTDEHYQLARVHCKIHNEANEARIIQIFLKLRCVEYDASLNRWIWMYCDEAKNIRLKVAHNKVPREMQPVILGAFYFRGEKDGFFNFNSFQRTVKGLIFFNKHIGRSILEFTEIDVLNKLFAGTVDHATIHASIFDQQSSPRNTADVMMDRIGMIASTAKSPGEKMRLLLNHTKSMAKQPLPEIERIPCNYYADGIRSVDTTLRMREQIAIKHWLGNTSYSFHDLLQEMFFQRSPEARL